MRLVAADFERPVGGLDTDDTRVPGPRSDSSGTKLERTLDMDFVGGRPLFGSIADIGRGGGSAGVALAPGCINDRLGEVV